MMKKYLMIVQNEIQRQFTYRASIAAYAFGNIAELVTLAVIWTAVFKGVAMIRGYTYQEMITYVIFSWFFSFLTTTYAFERNIARDIHLGTLANMIMKPVSYLRYSITVASGRIVIAFFIFLAQTALVILFFREQIVFSADAKTILLLCAMLIASYFINLFCSIVVGFFAFWTIEIDGMYYFFKTVSKFLSGFYFPINLLPAALASVSFAFPFAYTVFVPVQLFLGKISFAEGLRGLAVEMLWLVVLYVIIKIMWRSGLKKYESVGI